jgi:N6-L-threonylcarbamoyladenine synthase
MIAFAGAMRLSAMRLNADQLESNGEQQDYSVSVKPRWDLAELQAP